MGCATLDGNAQHAPEGPGQAQPLVISFMHTTTADSPRPSPLPIRVQDEPGARLARGQRTRVLLRVLGHHILLQLPKALVGAGRAGRGGGSCLLEVMKMGWREGRGGGRGRAVGWGCCGPVVHSLLFLAGLSCCCVDDDGWWGCVCCSFWGFKVCAFALPRLFSSHVFAHFFSRRPRRSTSPRTHPRHTP